MPTVAPVAQPAAPEAATTPTGPAVGLDLLGPLAVHLVDIDVSRADATLVAPVSDAECDSRSLPLVPSSPPVLALLANEEMVESSISPVAPSVHRALRVWMPPSRPELTARVTYAHILPLECALNPSPFIRKAIMVADTGLH